MCITATPYSFNHNVHLDWQMTPVTDFG
jgi:hypothetical protein